MMILKYKEHCLIRGKLHKIQEHILINPLLHLLRVLLSIFLPPPFQMQTLSELTQHKALLVSMCV